VVAYSPDGQALEEENALGIRSCSKFGYDRQLPYLVAQNSASPLVLFESFEKQYLSGTYLEDRVDFSWNSFGVINSTAAHAGKKSFSSSNASAFLYRSGSRSLGYTLAAPQAMQVKGWFRSKDVTGFIDPIVAVTLNGTPAVPMKVVARVGEWVLCEATVSLPFGSSAYSIDITCVNVTANSGTTWIDDVRVQPKDAQMTAYVYDPNNYRLLATFDDQHFGMYYQYNDEGKLVRKLIETERGLRTVQETQYNTPQDQNRQWP
jgi:YD repeat-containing protein